MITLRHVLVPTDFSAASATALVYGRELASRFDAQLHIVTVVENFFSFTEDPTEWTGTDIVFEISREDGKTVLNFTHVNLVPECQCYVACSDGWQFYIQDSLRDLIATGRGRPNVGEAVTGSELALAD